MDQIAAKKEFSDSPQFVYQEILLVYFTLIHKEIVEYAAISEGLKVE